MLSFLSLRPFHAKSLLASIFTALSLQSHAATFTLENPTIIFNESDQRVAFNVKNDGESPMLLVSKLEDLGEDKLSQRILIAPPIARIDPGQSQQINFSLKKGAKLENEYLLKASFEGVSQTGRGSLVMPVRQEIGFLVQAGAVPVSKTPWDNLMLSIANRQLTLSNPSAHVIRLAPSVKLLPANKMVALPHAYLMPGESLTVEIGDVAEKIEIVPLSRYGLVLPAVTMPIQH
ncbi:fimbria/pilus chaperone family protein [Burkholderia oklahomensis]|uniref:fimbria/pilus chaperone family protein n=1 Tax=Burkholderia oklahomensis TaxID=342113 RepID=UPI0004742C37|nr:fimbria/pilus chaperone family protein [Burkholderia oklahomensis]AOI47935.1 fimbrial protein [Burkholderia oklahomensis C6786]KUY50193.1 fimbrial protein [Burkholderia oklahomensis C6786]MBI0363965.1 fimbria/pilus periplasmic chaperone [Burkholderia oklahomensis]